VGVFVEFEVFGMVGSRECGVVVFSVYFIVWSGVYFGLGMVCVLFVYLLCDDWGCFGWGFLVLLILVLRRLGIFYFICSCWDFLWWSGLIVCFWFMVGV